MVEGYVQIGLCGGVVKSPRKVIVRDTMSDETLARKVGPYLRTKDNEGTVQIFVPDCYSEQAHDFCIRLSTIFKASGYEGKAEWN
jgi:hypothetical protein